MDFISVLIELSMWRQVSLWTPARAATVLDERLRLARNALALRVDFAATRGLLVDGWLLLEALVGGGQRHGGKLFKFVDLDGALEAALRVTIERDASLSVVVSLRLVVAAGFVAAVAWISWPVNGDCF